MASMSLCFTSYAVLVVAACVGKCISPDFAGYIEMVFFAAVLVTMAGIYVEVLKERCGQGASGPVLVALLPWVVMLGGSMVALKLLPGWIQPFSNTFGYLAVHIPMLGATDKLLAVLTDEHKTSVELIKKNPGLMLNEFASSTFFGAMEKMKAEGLVRADAPLEDLRGIVAVKDAVAVAVWYILVGSVAITTSFNVLMNFTCQKTVLKEAPVLEPEEEGTEYIIDD
jgi:hypothetical protein